MEPTNPRPDGSPSGADEALDHLRRADPAAGVHPDDAALRAAVDHKLADETAASMPASGPLSQPDGEPVVPLTAKRRSTTRTWVAAAAAAAVVVAVGAGGYLIGRSGNGTTAEVAPPISLTTVASGGDSMVAGDAPAKEAANRAADASMAGGWYGRTVFTGAGFSTEPTTAQGYTFDTTGAYTTETAARLATALGVEGSPVEADGAISVGSTDYTAPGLWLYPDASVTFSYSNPAADTYSCDVEPLPEPVTEGDAAPSDTTSSDAASSEIAPDGGCTQRSFGPAPQGDDAIAAAREAIAATGADPDSFTYTTSTWDDGNTTQVTADAVVDGQAIGMQWWINLTGGGMSSLGGFLGTPVSLGDYQVISAADALDRLGDSRFGAVQSVWATSDDVAPSGEYTPPTAPPAQPQPGTTIDWPVTTVDLVDARLGLTQVYQNDSSIILAPAYEFSDAAGNSWSVLAVADSQIDFSTP